MVSVLVVEHLLSPQQWANLGQVPPPCGEPFTCRYGPKCLSARPMAIREILEVPDPRLKTVSTPVESFDEELKALVADMFDSMYAAHGIGLAAIQVGVPKIGR